MADGPDSYCKPVACRVRKSFVLSDQAGLLYQYAIGLAGPHPAHLTNINVKGIDQ